MRREYVFLVVCLAALLTHGCLRYAFGGAPQNTFARQPQNTFVEPDSPAADAEGWQWDPVRQVHWRPLPAPQQQQPAPAYLFSPPYPAGGWQGFSPPGGVCPPGRR